MATQTYPARTIRYKNDQLDDFGRSSEMDMLLQHGYIRCLQNCHHHCYHPEVMKDFYENLSIGDGCLHKTHIACFHWVVLVDLSQVRCVL